MRTAFRFWRGVVIGWSILCAGQAILIVLTSRDTEPAPGALFAEADLLPFVLAVMVAVWLARIAIAGLGVAIGVLVVSVARDFRAAERGGPHGHASSDVTE